MTVNVIWKATGKQEQFDCDYVTCDGSIYELVREGACSIMISVDAPSFIDWRENK